MTELEFQLRASDLLETVKKIQRDFAEVKSTMEELITALHPDVEMWRDRCAEPIRVVLQIQRDYAGLRVLIEELVTALRQDAEMWQSRYEAERRDHERSIRHAEKAMNEDVS